MYEQMKEKIEKIHSSVSEFGMLIGPKTEVEKVPGFDGAPSLEMNSDAKSFEDMADDIRKGIFKVLFMGEFKNGKSTAINSIVGTNTVPTKATACTAIITILVYGSKVNRASVYMKDNPDPVEMSLEEFFEKYQLTIKDQRLIEDQGYIDRFKDVEYAIIESEHPIFENGVRIVDSPGLGEAISREKTTANFVSSANAIVFLLSAIKLFSIEEKKYISQNFANKQLKNVFFVVNRVNQLTEPVDSIMETVEYNLEPVFEDKDGKFDRELYEKRVFYVDAWGAYTAKQAGNLNELQTTGIPKFEKTLEEFLSSEDRVVATFQSTLTAMANTYKNAIATVDNKKQANSLPLKKLEENYKKSSEILKGLEGKVKSMEKAFTTTSQLVQTKIYESLLNYVTVEMPNMWDKDAEKNEAKFGVTEVLKLAWGSLTTWDKDKRSEKQNAIIKPLADSVQSYIMEKLDDWAKTTGTLISPEIANLNQEIGDQVVQFDMDLARASKAFANDLDSKMADGQTANPIQLGLSLIQGDASVIIENAGGGNFTWGEWIKKYVVQAVMQMILLSVFTGGMGFVAWIVMESIQTMMGANRIRERFLQSMSTKLFGELKNVVAAQGDKLKAGIDQRFTEQFNALAKRSRQLIAEEKARQEKTLRDKADEQFNFDEQEVQMDCIIARLFDLMNVVYSQMYGKELILSEVDNIASTAKA